MTLDRDALLKLCDEADAEWALTTQDVEQWSTGGFVELLWDSCEEQDRVDAAWIADAHEREGLLTAAVREALDAVMLLKLDEEGLSKRDDLRLRNMRLQEQRITALEQLAEERERVAEWLISHQLATGHGDTISDLLDAWEQQLHDWMPREAYDHSQTALGETLKQLAEARAEIDQLGALLDRERAGSRNLSENAHHFAEQLAEARTRIGELEAGK